MQPPLLPYTPVVALRAHLAIAVLHVLILSALLRAHVVSAYRDSGNINYDNNDDSNWGSWRQERLRLHPGSDDEGVSAGREAHSGYEYGNGNGNGFTIHEPSEEICKGGGRQWAGVVDVSEGNSVFYCELCFCFCFFNF